MISENPSVRLLGTKEQLQDYTVKTGLTVSKVIRKALKEFFKNQNIADTERVLMEIRQSRISMSRVGGNLNQIAHYFNLTGSVYPDSLKATHEALQREFGSIMTLFKKIENDLSL